MGALLVAVVAGILVWAQVQHAKKVRKEQNRSHMLSDFEFEGREVVFALWSISASPAMNVRIHFDQPLQDPRIRSRRTRRLRERNSDVGAGPDHVDPVW
ncbi:MAG: hypothetical protein PIR53_16345 [Nocardioides alkalitolerans]